jgi:enediyne biosynthesis protein E3
MNHPSRPFRPVLIALAASGFALLLTSCATTREPTVSQLAEQHFERGETEAGFALLEEHMQQDASNLELGNFYRRHIVRLNQEDRAISFFKKLTQDGNAPAEAYYNFAFAYIDKIPRVGPMGAGFLSKRSIAQFKIVQDREPDDWIANYGIGMNYLHWPDYFKKTEGALGYFEKCLQIQQGKPAKPQYLLTYLRMGDALVRGGDVARAYETWRAGEKQFPGHADLLERLNTPRERIEAAIRELYNPNNSIGAIDTDISILWAKSVPQQAVPMQRELPRQAGVGGQLQAASPALDASQMNLFSWFTRNLPYLSDRGALSKVDMSALGVRRGSQLDNRVNAIAHGMISGFMAELEGESADSLRQKAAALDSFTRPFFHEGLGMGYAAAVSVDSGGELKRMSETLNAIDPNFQRLHLAGAGMWFGLENAREVERIAESFRQLDPFAEAYAYEGYGFARTLFYYKSNPQVLDTGTQLRTEAAENFYHGVGRALWILSGADPKAADRTLEAVPQQYRQHSYSGYAMGMAFTQVDDVAAVFARVADGGDEEHRRLLLTGIAMGLYIRRLGDPTYVDTMLQKAAAGDRCRARELLSVGSAALQDAAVGRGDMHANWRAAIRARIESSDSAHKTFAACV